MSDYKVDLNLNLLQNIRCVQALMEEYKICVNSEYLYIFDYLNKVFNTTIYKSSCNLSNKKKFNTLNIFYNHSKPGIYINEQEWILIYPIKMLDCLQKSWRKDRYKVTFSGFLTKKRLRFIKPLIETRTSFKKTCFLIMCQIILSIPNKLAFRLRYSWSLKISKMEILFTNKGRIFPVKAWDQEYFNQLLESKFVFCPDGDFVWTYRFFESIICGAIPVVENHCVPYNGFKYLTLEQYLNGETLTDSDLISNFLKIKKEFTLRPF